MLIMVLMTLHCVRTMVGKLRVEPLVQRFDKMRVFRSVCEFCSVVNFAIDDCELAWLGCFQFSKTRHVIPVDV